MESANQALHTLSENKDISPSSAESPYGGGDATPSRRVPLEPAAVVKSLTKIVKADSEIPSRVADHLVDHLITRERVDVFFGLPGGAISPLHDALFRRVQVRVITTRHEADAVFAAAGYARATGKVGVALVTAGPGVLNAINALASAHLEGLPVLLLAGEAPRARFGQHALQEGSSYGLDVRQMARTITKATAEILSADSAPLQLAAVLDTMKRGKMGCGLITCPVDVTQRIAKPVQIGMAQDLAPLLDETALDRAATLLSEAKNPVVYAGNGLRGGDGAAALLAFADRAQIPVITTPHGKGCFPESHPLALGLFGFGQHDSAVEYLQAGVDCILAVGTSLSELSSNGWSALLTPRTALIHVDIEPSQIGRTYRTDLAIVGQAGPVLRSIANRLSAVPAKRFGIRRSSNPEVFLVGPEQRITPQRALWELQKVMPSNTQFTCDIGEHMLYALHYLKIDDPRGFTGQLGLCSMGSGMGVALGVASAEPHRPVAAVVGDGCFLMQMGVVEVAARAKLPIVFVVLNDQRFGMCEIGHHQLYGEPPAYALENTDLAAVGAALGARSIVIDAPHQIEKLDLAAMLVDGPVVLDIAIDRDVRMPNPRNYVLQHDLPKHDLN